MDSKTFYVLASRATDGAVFFTDCKEALKEGALREGDRKSVWDYTQLEAPQPASLDLQAGKRITKAPLIPRISANRIPVPLQKLHSMFMPKKQEPEREVSDE